MIVCVNALCIGTSGQTFSVEAQALPKLMDLAGEGVSSTPARQAPGIARVAVVAELVRGAVVAEVRGAASLADTRRLEDSSLMGWSIA